MRKLILAACALVFAVGLVACSGGSASGGAGSGSGVKIFCTTWHGRARKVRVRRGMVGRENSASTAWRTITGGGCRINEKTSKIGSMIKIIAGGKKHASWLKEACDEYEKRLRKPFGEGAGSFCSSSRVVTDS